MTKTAFWMTVLIAVLALVVPTQALFAEEEDWKDMKQESKRMKLDEMAEEALNALFEENAKAKELYSASYGWAVFDNLKIAWGISGGGSPVRSQSTGTAWNSWRAACSASASPPSTNPTGVSDIYFLSG